ncbi:MAG: hypothetical protein IT371_00865 [Deltaproteobacteria bacterium]|nr:hypothetical protein [Deltaproteobacteria bacterium]
MPVDGRAPALRVRLALLAVAACSVAASCSSGLPEGQGREAEGRAQAPSSQLEECEVALGGPDLTCAEKPLVGATRCTIGKKPRYCCPRGVGATDGVCQSEPPFSAPPSCALNAKGKVKHTCFDSFHCKAGECCGNTNDQPCYCDAADKVIPAGGGCTELAPPVPAALPGCDASLGGPDLSCSEEFVLGATFCAAPNLNWFCCPGRAPIRTDGEVPTCGEPPARATLPASSATPDGAPCPCGSGQLCVRGSCRPLAGTSFCSGAPKALALVDQRLYAQVAPALHDYLEAACARRGFAIRLAGVQGLDAMPPAAIRALLKAEKSANAALEGVLLVGNVPLPTFFLGRVDVPQARYWTRYYEDLDMQVKRVIPEGTALPECSGTPPVNWPCVVPKDVKVPFPAPPHDFDDFEQGPRPGRELWAAFLPVGFAADKRDYAAWGRQLRPYLAKTLAFYRAPETYARNIYHVGNDLGQLGQLAPLWPLLGATGIDYYAINTLGPGRCRNNRACYVRAPLEQYASMEEFLTYARTLPWIDEGWQAADIFLGHLNGSPAFPRRVVWVNGHGTPQGSLLTSAQARTGIAAGKGALVALMSGCMVGSYQRPGDTLPKDAWPVPPAEDNLLVSLVYGKGAFVSAIGSVPIRSASPDFGPLLLRLYEDSYLGAANRHRMDSYDQRGTSSLFWREGQDILVGDPFVDAL